MAKAQKPELTTLEKVSDILEAVVPVDTYIQHRGQLVEAFEKLNNKKAKAESERKAAMQKAGAREASNLMGKSSGENVSDDADNFTHLRDQQDKLKATEDAIHKQQKEFNEQYDQFETKLRVSSGSISDLLLADLEAELEQVGKQVSHILNRLYVVGKIKDIRDIVYADLVQKIQIPSLEHAENYVTPPYRLHPREHTVMAEAWKDDPAAMKLFKLLEPLAITQRKLRNIEHNLEMERKRKLAEEKEQAA